MSAWWDTLEILAKVYWMVAFASSLLFLVVIGLTVAGTDSAEMGDADFDGGIDFQFLNFKNTVGFFTIFAWSGLACIYSDYSQTTTLIVSIICGLLMMFAMAGLFYLLRNMGQDATLKMENTVGLIGEVYIPIGHQRTTIGKVQIKVQGSLRELDALTDAEVDYATGTVVRVKEVISDHILLVEKI
jgi:hypothetical protein